MNLQKITHRFTQLFPGDFSGNPVQRQTPDVLFAIVQPVGFANPKLLLFNENLSKEIGLGKLHADEISFLVGNELPENIQSYATAYAGHQFGNWAGQLGDGRAILAGEIMNNKGITTELQWKGAGATPYSRFADGRAVLRSSVREYLMCEAMHHLTISTTRALSLCLTGEEVVRDILYDGNPKHEKGAVIIRTAECFLRFGHFELLAAQNNIELLKKLADFCINEYFPEILSEGNKRYQGFFEAVMNQTMKLVINWFRVGFVHGVMNTDNMSILGDTIDYGPFSMLDEFDLNFTPNTTDLPGKRYAFGKQPQIAQWNLWQLANALFPIVEDKDFLEESLNRFSENFWKEYDKMMAKKLGFNELLEEDSAFFIETQKLMTDLSLDYTLFFSELENAFQIIDVEKSLEKLTYRKTDLNAITQYHKFLEKYKKRIERNTVSKKEMLQTMQKNNPKFILRNYLLYECIVELENGNREMLDKLLSALETPYLEKFPEFSGKRPWKYNGKPGSSMLSCSS